MKKILIAETNVNEYLEHPERKTGVWLEEITSFYDVVTKAGYEVDFGSPKGGKVSVDPASADADPETLRIYNTPEFRHAALEDTKKLSDLNPDDYIAIYFGGGHGVIWDFPNDRDLASIAEKIYAAGGYITSVCHGEAGLINLKDENGDYLVKGKKINGFTNEEEALNGTDALLPYSAEDELTKHGAEFVKGKAYTEFAVEDQRFITGQNPFSSTKVAKLLVEALK
ncbi:MAG: type 1 glutamine amidotransferase domain-containing protein [Pseudoramibacter sp.]